MTNFNNKTSNGIKKILLMIAGVVLAAPFFVSAQTVPITSLTDQFTQAQSTCVDLKYNLSYRSRDARTNGEVSDLQDFLNTNGYLSGEPTGYFGLMTVEAVKKFQVATGLGRAGSPGYGGVGPKSRAKIKEMTCGGVAAIAAPISERTAAASPVATPSLPAGCVSAIGFSPTTGNRCSEPLVTTSSIPNVSISLSSTNIKLGEKFSIFWKSNNAERCEIASFNSSGEEIDREIAAFSGVSTGAVHVGELAKLGNNPTLVLYCRNANGVAKASVTLNILGSVKPVLPDGCASSTGYSSTTGRSCSEYSPSSIFEQITCSFKSTTEQKCWGDAPSTSVGGSVQHFSCSGVGSCLVNVKGLKGTPITWGSSCGGSANTTIDGTNEYASFGGCVVGDQNATAPTIKGIIQNVNDNYVITISGANFSLSANEVKIDGKAYAIAPSNNGSTISFVDHGLSGRKMFQVVTSVGSNIVYADIVSPTTVAPSVTLVASPTSVAYGGQSTLSWSSTNATSCKFIGGDRQFMLYENTTSGKARYTQSLYAPQVYTIVCAGANGATATQSVSVNVATTSQTSSPTIEALNTPTLTLQYDAAGKESMLVGKATVKITAGSSPINLAYSQGNYHIARMLAQLNNESGQVYANSLVYRAIGFPECVSTASAGCLLPANSSMIFSIENKAKVNELFAGTYYMNLEKFSYYNDSKDSNGISIEQIIPSQNWKGPLSSNRVTIVGERAPYLKNISTMTDTSGAIVGHNIWGVRFSPTANTVTLNGISKTLPAGASDYGSGTVVSFKSSDFGITTAGSYLVQVSTAEGASNVLFANIIAPTMVATTTPVTINASANSNQYKSGIDTIRLSYDVANAPAGAAIEIDIKGSKMSGGKYPLVSRYLLDGTTRTVDLSVPQNSFPSHGGVTFLLSPYAGYLPLEGPLEIRIYSSSNILLASTQVPMQIISGSIPEPTPTITSVTPLQVVAGATTPVELYGTNFSPSLNIALTGPGADTSVVPTAVSQDGKKLTFNFPSTITTPGNYSVQVYGLGSTGSNFLSLNLVSAVTTISTPQITSPSTVNVAQSETLNQTISWQTVSGAIYYNIKIDSLAPQNIGNISYISFNVKAGLPTSLSTVGTHTFNVQACNASSCGGWSSTVVVNVTAPVVAPTLTTVEPTSQNVSPHSTGVKVGSFTVAAGGSNIVVKTVNVTVGLNGYPMTNLSNLIVKSSGVVLGTPIGILSLTNPQVFSFLPVAVLANQTKTFDVYADIGGASSGFMSTIVSVEYIDSISLIGGQLNANAGVITTTTAGALIVKPSNQTQFASIISAFSSAPTLAAATPKWEYSWTRNLEIGSLYVEDVIALQTALAKEGVYGGEITGGFYSQTYLAVKAFQAKYGIESTGFVGPTTREKLNELY